MTPPASEGGDDPDFAARVAAVGDASAADECLISVAVPPDEAVADVRERVEKDRAEAALLGEVADERLEALERARRRLAAFDATPEHGLAVYAGVLDGDLRDYVFADPPDPITDRVYARGTEFETDPLGVPGRDRGTWGLLVVERGEAAVGRYDGAAAAGAEAVTVATTVEATLPGKTRVDGRSAAGGTEQVADFFDEVAEAARRVFLAGGADPALAGDADAEVPGDAGRETDVEGLLLGGTEATVERFREGEHLDPRLVDAVAGTYVAAYASVQGLRRVVEAARADGGPLAADAEAREALSAFLDELGDDGDGNGSGERVVYGLKATDEALTYDAVETLLVSTDRPAGERRDLRERVREQGGECVVVPADFPDGERFAEGFDGVGALLRFPIE